VCDDALGAARKHYYVLLLLVWSDLVRSVAALTIAAGCCFFRLHDHFLANLLLAGPSWARAGGCM
jgi:hypothetical protein